MVASEKEQNKPLLALHEVPERVVEDPSPPAPPHCPHHRRRRFLKLLAIVALVALLTYSFAAWHFHRRYQRGWHKHWRNHHGHHHRRPHHPKHPHHFHDDSGPEYLEEKPEEFAIPDVLGGYNIHDSAGALSSFDRCNPNIPLDEPFRVKYNSDDLPSLDLGTTGTNIMSDITFRRSDSGSKDIEVEAEVFVSEEGLAGQVEVDMSEEHGVKRFMIHTPKVLLPNKCFYAKVVVTVPESVDNLEDLRATFTRGDLRFEHGFRKLHFGSVFAAAIYADLSFDEIKSDNIALKTVHGDINGHFECKKFQAKCVYGDIEASIDVAGETKNRIEAKAVYGDIDLEVSEFHGHFSMKTMYGDTKVKGKNVEFDVKKPHKKTGVHYSE